MLEGIQRKYEDLRERVTTPQLAISIDVHIKGLGSGLERLKGQWKGL